MSATRTGRAWSCTIRLVVDDARVSDEAFADLSVLLDTVDRQASRFRADSDLTRANARPGRPTPVPALLSDLIATALDAAADTAGAVDPTVGLAMQRLGYDRDIAAVLAEPRPAPALHSSLPAAQAWTRVRLHREAGLVTVPHGSALDLGATAKAYVADHAAQVLARRFRTAVLVELGGDLAVASERPDGWCIRVAEREGEDGQLILVRRGGVATSTTTIRRWQLGDATAHHILDPRTGRPADGPWRTASVAATSALAANVASTAAIVLGADAVAWLTARGLAARLVDRDGAVVTVGPWPADRSTAPDRTVVTA